MNKIRPIIAATLLALATGAFAQMPSGDGHRSPPTIAKQLNLDPARAAQVDSIMQSSREKASALHAQMKALHEGTRAQLATVLTPEEMKKLQEARGRGHGHHQRISISQRLGLDETRGQQVDAIMASTRSQAKAIHGELKSAATPAARAEAQLKMKALRDNTRSQLAGVLTPQEMQKLQEGQGRRGSHGGHGGGWGNGSGPREQRPA